MTAQRVSKKAITRGDDPLGHAIGAGRWSRAQAGPIRPQMLPPPASLISRQRRRFLPALGRYRRALEAATIAVHGQVGLTEAHHIDAAGAAETHAQVCRWLLRQRLDDMTHADILSCSREIPRAKADRNRAIAALNLDHKPDV